MRELDIIRDEARSWHVHLTSGHASAEDRSAFEAWRSSDHRCDAAYNRIASLVDAVRGLPREPIPEARGHWPRAGAHWQKDKSDTVWWRRPIFAIAASLLLAISLFAVSPFFGPSRSTDVRSYATAVAQQGVLTLDDGSTVTLGAKTKVEIDYSASRRLVRLVSGEAFFNVAKDPARPFIVDAGNTAVRAVGTRFNVKRVDGGKVSVNVEEGVVEVSRPKAALDKAAVRAGETLRLSAGEHVIAVPSGAIAASQPTPIEQSAVAPWRNGRLRYMGAPLSELVADARRYYPGEIKVDPKVGNLSVTTSFRVGEVDSVIENLPMILPVVVEKGADQSYIIREP